MEILLIGGPLDGTKHVVDKPGWLIDFAAADGQHHQYRRHLWTDQLNTATNEVVSDGLFVFEPLSNQQATDLVLAYLRDSAHDA